MKVFVLGGVGELGSNFSKLCLDSGHEVTILDLTRFLEGWRLKELDIMDRVKYVWKSTFDITKHDLEGFDLILDCACQADRPLGTSSPKYTLLDNLFGPLTLLECTRRLHKKPLVIYPSSSVEFLGVPREEQPITEYSIPKPTNLYGLTKWMAEELYLTYWRTFQIPTTIIRTGSCYGPMMRTDQFVAQCIIKCLRGESMEVRSPKATRTYTFTGDVMDFYSRFIKKVDEEPETLHGLVIANGGNAEDKPYETFEVAKLIKSLTQSESSLLEADYEPGEMLNGLPVFQWERSEVAAKVLGWKPKYTLQKGLHETIAWFKKWTNT